MFVKDACLVVYSVDGEQGGPLGSDKVQAKSTNDLGQLYSDKGRDLPASSYGSESFYLHGSESIDICTDLKSCLNIPDREGADKER